MIGRGRFAREDVRAGLLDFNRTHPQTRTAWHGFRYGLDYGLGWFAGWIRAKTDRS